MYCNNDIDYLKFLKDKDVYIFGAGVLGRRLCASMEKSNCIVAAFIDNIKSGVCCQKPIIGIGRYKELATEKSIIVICSEKYEKNIKRQLMDNNIYNFISSAQIDFGGGRTIMMKIILPFSNLLESLAAGYPHDCFRHILKIMMY